MPKEEKPVNPDDLKTPEDEGSASAILEAQRQARMFSGHPADVGGQEDAGGGEGDGDGAGEGDATPPAKEDVKPTGETPPEKKEEKPTPKTEDELPPGWTFRPKYKNQQEAELAQKEAERKMHEATSGKSDLERENEKLRQELEELKAGKKETPAAPAAPQETFVDRLTQALNEIDALDDTDPNYTRKRGEILAKAYQPLQGSEGSFTADQVKSMISQEVEQALSQKDKVAQEKDEATRAFNWYNSKAAEMGLDMSEGSPDRRLFWKLADDAPYENITPQQQVEFIVAEVNRFREHYGGTVKDEAARVKEHHQKHQILEKGGLPPGGKPPAQEEKTSIASILEHRRQQLRI